MKINNNNYLTLLQNMLSAKLKLNCLLQIRIAPWKLSKSTYPKVFSFTFEVSENDADTIETFLDARANDSDSFTFTPPGEASSSQFVCENWSKSIPYSNRATIQATFREVFEPAS